MEQHYNLPVIDLVWRSARVFELSVDRQGIVFTPGDSMAIFDGEGSESRPYSIASGIDDPVLRFLIQRFPDGQVSRFLSTLTHGDTITATAPFGWFRPGGHGGDAPFVFIASGTGIAPFLSYLRADAARPPELCLYGVRTLGDAIDLSFVQSVCRTQVAVSRENGHDYHNGRVTDLVPLLEIDALTHFYLCGLDAMIADVTAQLEAAGADFTRIHREVFFYAES